MTKEQPNKAREMAEILPDKVLLAVEDVVGGAADDNEDSQLQQGQEGQQLGRQYGVRLWQQIADGKLQCKSEIENLPLLFSPWATPPKNFH